MDTSTFHPMMVHFPIALLLVGFLFATLALFCKKCNSVSDCNGTKPSCILKVGYWLLALGALSAAASVTTGALFTTEMEGIMGQLRDTHQALAFTTMIVSLIAAAIYTYFIYKAPKVVQVHYIGYALYVVAAVMVGITGHYGGMMVYSF